MVEGLKDGKIDTQKSPRAGERCYRRSELEYGLFMDNESVSFVPFESPYPHPLPSSPAVTCNQ